MLPNKGKDPGKKVFHVSVFTLKDEGPKFDDKKLNILKLFAKICISLHAHFI